MTLKDQNDAIGRLVVRFSAAKSRRAALLAEAQEMSKMLGDTATELRHLDYRLAFWDGRVDAHASHRKPGDYQLSAQYPTRERLTALLDELRAVSTEIRECRQLMTDAGLGIE